MEPEFPLKELSAEPLLSRGLRSPPIEARRVAGFEVCSAGGLGRPWGRWEFLRGLGDPLCTAQDCLCSYSSPGFLPLRSVSSPVCHQGDGHLPGNSPWVQSPPLPSCVILGDSGTRLQCLWHCCTRAPLGVFLGGLNEVMSVEYDAGGPWGLSRPMPTPRKATVRSTLLLVHHPSVCPHPQGVILIETHLQAAALG